jgi:hypothetical protein
MKVPKIKAPKKRFESKTTLIGNSTVLKKIRSTRPYSMSITQLISQTRESRPVVSVSEACREC